MHSRKRRRKDNPRIHPRNRYSESAPDFGLLASLYPSFADFVFPSRFGRPTIDWTDFNATRELTRVLLLHDHGVHWWIPDRQLCPTVPNLSNYIHWIEDFLASELIPPNCISDGKILETAFKKETVGLVTREQYVEKRVNIRNKIEEEEKEKLQKLQEEEEELELQKRENRRVKVDSRLSFVDDIENGSDEDDVENKVKIFGCGKLGKDPSVETSFLPDRERGVEEQAERERLRKQWLCEQELIKNEPLEITYSYWDGTGHSIGEFLRAVQQQLAPEFREVRTTSVENLLYVKEDLIIPHQHSLYELIINKAWGKSGPSHAGKVVERHWYEKNKHIFPASRWEIYDPSKKWERYTIHGD